MVNFAVDNTLFNVEEKVVLNKVASDMNKEEFLAHCELSKTIAVDEEMKVLMDGLITKVQVLSVEEWKNLVSFIPFDVLFSDADLSGDYEAFADME